MGEMLASLAQLTKLENESRINEISSAAMIRRIRPALPVVVLGPRLETLGLGLDAVVDLGGRVDLLRGANLFEIFRGRNLVSNAYRQIALRVVERVRSSPKAEKE